MQITLDIDALLAQAEAANKEFWATDRRTLSDNDLYMFWRKLHAAHLAAEAAYSAIAWQENITPPIENPSPLIVRASNVVHGAKLIAEMVHQEWVRREQSRIFGGALQEEQ